MAAKNLKPAWAVEDIPDLDLLFKRVHRKLFKADGTIMTGAFSNAEMSVDWARYSAPEETRGRKGNPEDNAVAQMCAGDVRKIPEQSVVHEPTTPNRAHSHVAGRKTQEVKVKLRRLVTTALPLPTC